MWVYRETIAWRPALVMLAGAMPATFASAPPLHVHVVAMEMVVVIGACSLSGAPSPAGRRAKRPARMMLPSWAQALIVDSQQ